MAAASLAYGCSLARLRLQEKGLLERGVQPLGAWALGQTLDAMSLYLRLGFELDLFSPCEFQMNYWYLGRTLTPAPAPVLTLPLTLTLTLTLTRTRRVSTPAGRVTRPWPTWGYAASSTRIARASTSYCCRRVVRQ